MNDWDLLGHYFGDGCDSSDPEAENELAGRIWHENAGDEPHMYVPLHIRYPHQFDRAKHED